MRDCIYTLNTNKDTLDGEPARKETMRRLAHDGPKCEFWLSRHDRMEPGDRLWFFFSRPESAVAVTTSVRT
ncbi:hypothetical protein [Streptomyces sp. HB132]|uniref:hypothetical protein n=1 Tax=Streptomyces sp. HB132 TaxID=767388 RepID=UPI001960835C|nr:hypothetical protein [Streptomyces sp. HB132]MBM7440088.1 hypothetical protein [Streptomyces sp. HB132]